MEIVEEPSYEEVILQEDQHELVFNYEEVPEQEATNNAPTKTSKPAGQPTSKPGIKSQESKDSDEAIFDDKFSYFFYKITGADERMDAFELQRVMSMTFREKFPKNTDFSLEACRAMISSMDHHRVGKLNFTQFKELWQNLMKWMHAFEGGDVNKDLKIDYSDLCVGLKKLGFRLEERTIQVLMNRFQNHSKVIELDDFLQICCKTIAARKSYESVVKDGDASLDTFMMQILYN